MPARSGQPQPHAGSLPAPAGPARCAPWAARYRGGTIAWGRAAIPRLLGTKAATAACLRDLPSRCVMSPTAERLSLVSMNNPVLKDTLIGEEWTALRQIGLGAK